MANIILKLIPNKWDTKYFFSFIKKNDRNPKDRHFLAYNTFKYDVKAGEFWECFMCSQRELKEHLLVKVVPFKRIDERKLMYERKRVSQFNRELSVMERLVGTDFEKIIYKKDNRPFLLCRQDNREELARKYPNLIFMQEAEGLLARISERAFQRPFKRPNSGPFNRPR